MARTAQDFAGLIERTLPGGHAWPTEPGTTFAELLEALAVTFSDVDAAAARMLLEFDPRTATELMPEWLEALGLPGDCMGTLSTLEEKRRVAGAKLGAYGGQTVAYFVAVAASLGFPVTVEEAKVFSIGDDCGLPCYGDGWEHVWIIIAPHDQTAFFLAGQGVIGDPLATFATLPLECLLQELKPAHTVLFFRYTGGLLATGGPAVLEVRAEEPTLEQS